MVKIFSAPALFLSCKKVYKTFALICTEINLINTLKQHQQLYEVRSWTKCSTRRFIIAFHHFGTPILLFESSFSGFDSSKCQFVSAFYKVNSSFPEVDSSSCLFDSSADVFDLSFLHSWSFWLFVVLLCRFVVSIWRFLISTR